CGSNDGKERSATTSSYRRRLWHVRKEFYPNQTVDKYMFSPLN
ncbi:hypothetical protein EUTSA_v100219551mg, partial [Eutrema salsugineum]